MTDQQKSDREKAKQAWFYYALDNCDSERDFTDGVNKVKSSLKRDIEKKIEKSKLTIDPMLRVVYVTALKEVLELIETVEP